jgi:hypothetical protein
MESNLLEVDLDNPNKTWSILRCITGKKMLKHIMGEGTILYFFTRKVIL